MTWRLTDKYDKVLLHMNGVDTSTTFTDESGKIWTANGNAQIDTAQSVFGGASALFDGTGDWIDTPDSADFDIGNGDFTIDFRIRMNSIAALQRVFGQCDSSATASTICLYANFDGTGKNIQAGFYSSTTAYQAVGSALSVSTWYHIALIRSGNNLYVATNGTLSAPTSVTGIAANNSANKFSIGRLGELTTATLNGWIDEFRFSKGIARWTGNFTPLTKPYQPLRTLAAMNSQ